MESSKKLTISLTTVYAISMFFITYSLHAQINQWPNNKQARKQICSDENGVNRNADIRPLTLVERHGGNENLPIKRTQLPYPELGKYYHGVHVGNGEGAEDAIIENISKPDSLLDSYLNAVGQKQVAWVYFSQEWTKCWKFPKATAQKIRARGSVPFIRLMLRTGNETDDKGNPKKKEKVFSLEAISDGHFDNVLTAWGTAARDYNSPLIVEWGTEMNGVPSVMWLANLIDHSIDRRCLTLPLYPSRRTAADSFLPPSLPSGTFRLLSSPR